MTTSGHFDYDRQTWVAEGEAPTARQTDATSAPRRKRWGASELILLIGGISAVCIGLALLAGALSAHDSDDPARATELRALGDWLCSAGLLLLVLLVFIHAFVDVWQRRMRQPE